MDKNEILENNKLIVEFLGYKNISQNDPDFNFYSKNNKTPELELMSLLYHKDWNHLMSVVEKIQSIGYCVTISQIVKNKPICSIELGDMEEIYIENKSSHIDTVYEAVVDFIKWYNEQKN